MSVHPDVAGGVTAFSSERSGLHRWAQVVYAQDVAIEGPRLAAQSYLSAMVRPVDLTLKQYAWAGMSAGDLDMVRSVLDRRRARWTALVDRYSCREIYPKASIERYSAERSWFGRTLSVKEVTHHLETVESCLRQHPNYRIGILDSEELYFNFIVEGEVVLIEGGSEVLPEPDHRHVGGLRIDLPEIVELFRIEFERIWNCCKITDPDDVAAWLRGLREGSQHEADG